MRRLITYADSVLLCELIRHDLIRRELRRSRIWSAICPKCGTCVHDSLNVP